MTQSLEAYLFDLRRRRRQTGGEDGLYDRLDLVLQLSRLLQTTSQNVVTLQDLRVSVNVGSKVKLQFIPTTSDNDEALYYTAPELRSTDANNPTTDDRSLVYSLSILAYEICALQYAYSDLNAPDVPETIWRDGLRPTLSPDWPVELQWLLKTCWSFEAKARLSSLTEVEEILVDVIEQSYDDEMEESSLRSIYSSHLRSDGEDILTERDSSFRSSYSHVNTRLSYHDDKRENEPACWRLFGFVI